MMERFIKALMVEIGTASVGRLVCLVCLAGMLSVPVHASPPTGFTYLQWADEFNGSTLDTTKWNYRSAGAGYLVNNVAVANGYLVLTETTIMGTNYGGQISTQNSFNPTYGYFEASMQSAQTNALVSAFWIQTPYENNTNYNPATNGVEMDIIEDRPFNNSADNALHWNGYGTLAQSILNYFSPPTPLGTFHTYGMLWTPTTNVYYIDGVQVWQTNNPVSQRGEFIDLLIRSTLTTSSGGYGTVGTTNTQVSFDYVRYYPLPLTWDVNSGVAGAQDGSGTWNSGTLFWNGGTNIAKADNQPYSVTFGAGGSAGTVTISGSPITGQITFNPVGSGVYTLQGSGTLTISNGIMANAPANLNVPVVLGANQNWTVATNQVIAVGGVISGGCSLVADGSGTLMLLGTNTYTGQTVVSNGTLLVDGSIASVSAVSITAGATLTGNGIVNGTITLNGSISPGDGSGVGTLTTGSETWNGSGSYLFALNNPTNSSGWDSLNINGQLNFLPSGPFGGRFTIKLASLGTNNAAGPLTGFAYWNPYTWKIATASAFFLNFNPGGFVVDTTSFSNAYTGSFSVGTNGNSLVLTYTPAALVAPALNQASAYNAGGFGLSFSGPKNQTYRVLASTNAGLPLTDWQVLTNGTFGAGSVSFTDHSATNQQEFYQIASP